MRVLITGGAGFLGQRLVAALLRRGQLPDRDENEQPLGEITVVDTVFTPRLVQDPRVVYHAIDLSDPPAVAALFDQPFEAIFHLAAVVSASAEADFGLGWRVNLEGTRFLLEACRAQASTGVVSRLVFASSVAVFGGALPAVVRDTTIAAPEGSYGTQKLICELLLADYSRKGYVDGRALRIPTIVVRPGRPNGAASGFASGIIREPLRGEKALCPVPLDTSMWIASPAAALDALVHGFVVPKALWGPRGAVNLPGLTVRVGDMIDALRQRAGDDVADLVEIHPQPDIEALIRSWPARFETSRAQALGFVGDPDFAEILTQYLREPGVRG